MDWEKHAFRILNAIDKPILVIDRDFRIVAANRAACRSFCLSLNEIIGQECFKVSHKVDSPCWLIGKHCPVKLAFELKEKTRVIHEHNRGGKTVIEEIVAVPIANDHGEIDFIVEELNEVTELIQSIEIIEHLKRELNMLRGIIPICAACKKVRDDQGYWQQVEAYVRDRSDAEFSHSICPGCAGKLYPDFVKK